VSDNDEISCKSINTNENGVSLMTSDAKIGLLLGLVFIFVIAFIINGLPSFQRNVNTNELTTSTANAHSNPPGLAAKERKLQEVFEEIKVIQNKLSKKETSPSAENNIRSVTHLPNTTPPKTASRQNLDVRAVSAAQPAPKPIAPKISQSPKTRPVKAIRPRARVYVVQEGDNLAEIAKKCYGEEEGNKKSIVAGVFRANRRQLKFPDEIYVGQKLIIPPLSAAEQDKQAKNYLISADKFSKVKAIGQQYLAASKRRIKAAKWHVVQEGDSLWLIAENHLSDGSRYNEIAKLNADILDHEDNLTIGMRLRIPAK
jgi:nucleoid-associated protein YgaU